MLHPVRGMLAAMPSYGYSLMCELYGPKELLAQAARAEAAGFDFVTISDHFHPWLFSHHQSPYAWSVLGALAAQTRQVELVSLVTCPTIRYQPVIVAQKAATVAVMSDGRFRLGVGAGENLNEHVVGRGWAPVNIRHEMLEEAIEIIRALWRGGYYAHEGKHYRVDDARIFTLPEEPPPIYVAVSGPASVALAERAGDGMIATDPRVELTAPFAESGKPRYGQLALSIDEDEARGETCRPRAVPLRRRGLEGPVGAAEPSQLRGRDRLRARGGRREERSVRRRPGAPSRGNHALGRRRLRPDRDRCARRSGPLLRAVDTGAAASAPCRLILDASVEDGGRGLREHHREGHCQGDQDKQRDETRHQGTAFQSRIAALDCASITANVTANATNTSNGTKRAIEGPPSGN
jgi:G6PDH family F420-dependent oxidoreductase